MKTTTYNIKRMVMLALTGVMTAEMAHRRKLPSPKIPM